MASAELDLTSRPYMQDPSAPDPIPPHAGNTTLPHDALDDLFNYDPQAAAVHDDVGGNTTTRPGNGHTIDLTDRASDTGGRGLGIDEEVKVRKPRAPVAKLDEGRLLSTKGIPKLRRISKERLRFRGKGHEFSDVGRMLNLYQLWLDDLFPKAKFGDGLAIIEKLGHSKRVQVMRKEWIEEEKPKGREEDEEFVDVEEVVGDELEKRERGAAEAGREDDGGEHTTQIRGRTTEEDLFAMPTPRQAINDTEENEDRNMTNPGQAEPEGDELDQLLAEDSAMNVGDLGRQSNARNPATEDDFADEIEAMGNDW